ncbi:hypothetical protein ACG7TL_000203 [Trametes sanguinea]
MQTLEETIHKPTEEEQEEEKRQHDAAIHIQKAWRKRMRKQYLGPDFLWSDVALHARMKVERDAAEEGKNDSRDRWRRSALLAGRLQDGDDMLSKGGEVHPEAARKHLETQHWLELIDGKHRYGSNLKVASLHDHWGSLETATDTEAQYYHARWKQEDTDENFFKWLDRGGGKDLSLKECPRERLEKERITYLSPEQRLNYLVKIDNEGKLRWARNGQLVDTTAGRWKDAGGGRGIVPYDEPDGDTEPRDSFSAPDRSSSSSSSSSSSVATGQDNEMAHYVGLRRQPKNPVKRVLWKNFTLRGLVDRTLRKTIKRNTWIYVSDKNFNIFIGIKDPGTFQHSSFLAGGLVTSAGLISVKDGQIHTLSPLSGHYRTSIEHFRRFISVLEERGVDMTKVEISKAELALWGIEHLGKFKKKQAKVLKDTKEHTTSAMKKVAGALPKPQEDDGCNWKLEVLEGRKDRHRHREEAVPQEAAEETAGPGD